MYKALVLLILLFAGMLAQALNAAPAKTAFYIGSPVEDVLAVLGKPTSVMTLDDNKRGILYYNNAQVTIQNGKVDKWKGLPVQPPKADLPPFTLGTKRETALAAYGMPGAAYRTDTQKTVAAKTVRTSRETWEYNKSALVFINEALAGWNNAGDLKIDMGVQAPEAKPITFGATPAEVVAAAGTPPNLNPLNEQDSVWKYGSAVLVFHDGKVTGWDDFERQLKINAGDAKPGAVVPKLGGAKDDVLAALGTPYTVLQHPNSSFLWCYDRTVFAIDATGTVTEVATPRLQTLMNTLRASVEEWPRFAQRLLTQAHLDALAPALTDTQIYEFYTARNPEAQLFTRFRGEKGQAMVTKSNAVYSVAYRQGVSDAVSVKSSAELLPLLKNTNPDYVTGVRAVVAAYRGYQNDAYMKFFMENFVPVPTVAGKNLDDAKALLAQARLLPDVVYYKNGQVAAGVVTEQYPPAGYHLTVQAPVTLYVTQ